jgi:ketosteroid isomerase-like protein
MTPRLVPSEDPVASVREYIDAFNRGDAKGMAACFATFGSILDGMAPHLWSGPTAAEDWYRDVQVEAAHHGASDHLATLGTPLLVNITGDSAYVVIPASLTMKVHGKQITQSGAMFTVALRRTEDGWRIAAWAWTKGTSK